jgi:hypothetical protein
VVSLAGVELLIRLEGFTAYQSLINSEYCKIYTGVSLRVLRSVDKRERTQIIS